MLVLPIVDRELRVASRSRRMYLGRVVSGAAALAMSMYLIWAARFMMGGAMAGWLILKVTTYLAWALCLFGGANRTCDSLSVEKREDTLGLLFLTHLKGADVVLGKLLAGGLSTVLSLLGILPIISIPVLMGGVAGSDLVRIPLALFDSLFLALSVGLLVSACLRAQRAATAVAGGIIVLLAVALPSLAQVAERDWQNLELARWLGMPSPLHLQELAFNSPLGVSGNDFWIAFFLQFGMALAALVGACLIVPHSWKVRAEGVRMERLRARVKQWAHGTAADRVRRRTRFLKWNPWFWICYRDRFAPLWPLLFAVITVGTVGWCIAHYDIPKPPALALLFATTGVNDLMLRMRVAAVGATRLAEDRQSGALEMILSTPLTLRQIMKGQWMAIRRTHFFTHAALLVFFGILVGIAAQDEPDATDVLWVAMFFAMLSVGDSITLGYVAMWKGMRLATPRYAAGSAVVRVFLLPCFAWMVLLPLIHQVRPWQQFFDSHAPYSFLTAATLVWGSSSITALVGARRNLTRYFREAATDRYLFEQRFGFLRFLRSRSNTRSNAVAISKHGINRTAFAPAHLSDNR